MKTYYGKQIAYLTLIITFLFSIAPLDAQEDSKYITINGIIKDQKSKKILEYVNVSVPGTGIGTISNEDGRFTLKVNDSLQAKTIEFSRMGYFNKQIAIEKNNISDITVYLTLNATKLPEVIVQSDDPRIIVETALSKVVQNYSPNTNLLTGFYRETIKKGRNYIDISEAVIDIYKTPYNKGIQEDRVEVIKGRKLLSQKSGDTLAVKLLGGPTLSIHTDLIKNQDFLMDRETMNLYSFKHDNPVMLDQQQHYVIIFEPQYVAPEPLFYGKLYINRNNFTISKAEMSMDMSNKSKATAIILKKKPPKLRFNPEEVSFVINYKQHNGTTYLNYIRNQIRFKCDWKRRLFSTNYTVVSEMIVTDIKDENISKISRKAAFRDYHALTDKVGDFYDVDFWKDYNIIEPSESLESAINKLKKQYK